MQRRDFLKRAGMATALLPVTGRTARAAQPPRETILVVGAGLAGLAAAYRLQEAGKRVILIEARDAPGGRVRTVRGIFADGLYGELGAARIAETHEYVLHWVNDLHLTLTPFAPASGSAILAVGEKWARAGDAAARESLAPGLHADERNLSVPDLLVKYVTGVPDELAAGDVNLGDPRWGPFDRISWPAWLASRGASLAATRLMMLGGDSSGFSALFMLQQIMLHRDSHQYFKIDGGMDRLPRGIATALKLPIRYNCRLVKLERTGQQIRAYCQSGSGTDVIAADRAILAIPFSMLRRLEWNPPLSAEKKHIVDALTYFPASRLLLQTSSRFWAKAGLNGSARTDGPADIWDMGFGQKGEAGLISLTTGNDRIESKLNELPTTRQAAFGIGLAAAAFPQIVPTVQRTQVQIWGLDPYAGGAFSVFRPGQMTEWAGIIGKPEPRVHFAGEHLSPWNGWMEGALWSGERAAQEIIEN